DAVQNIRPGSRHGHHRAQALTAGDDSRLVAPGGQRGMRFSQRVGADVVEARGLQGRLRAPAISIWAASFAGVIGRSIVSIPSASATALARHTGVLMQFPSPTPFAPS